MEWLTQLLFGPVIFILAILYLKYPPKKINPLYGYRTKRSMKDQHSWEIANRHNGQLMLKPSLIIMVCQLIFYFFLDYWWVNMITIAITLGGLLFTIYLTEKFLKANG